MVSAGAVALVLGFVLPVVVRPSLGPRALDMPNHRSSHSTPVPRVGGAVLVIAAGIGILTALFLDARPSQAILGFAIAVAVIGFVDDLTAGISPWVRLLWQIACSVAFALVLVPVAGDSLHAGGAGIALVAIVGSLWLTAFTNAFNFMDGINGIALLTAIVGAVWFALVGDWIATHGITVISVIIAAACAGILPWNVVRARLFLGDAGSYFLGAALAGLALVVALDGAPLAVAVAPLLVFGADTAWTLVRRIVGHRGLGAHREHAYQRLVDLGYSQVAITSVVGVLTLTCCGWVWLTRTSGLLLSLSIPAVLCAGYLLAPAVIRRHRNREDIAWSPQRS